MNLRTIFAVVLVLSAVACASIETVAYTPNPARVTDPMAEATAMINANVVQGCVVDIENAPQIMTVKYACENGIGNSVVRFDQVDTIALQKSGDWYGVRVKHKSADDFFWTSKSRSDMERLLDALTALSLPAGATTAPAPGTSDI